MRESNKKFHTRNLVEVVLVVPQTILRLGTEMGFGTYFLDISVAGS